MKHASCLFSEDVYSVLTFECLLYLHLGGTSKLFKAHFVYYVGSATLCTKGNRNFRGGKAFVRFKESMFRAFNAFLMSTEMEFPESGMLLTFRGLTCHHSLTYCSKMMVCTECWRGKTIILLKYCFHSFARLQTRGTVYTEDVELTKVNSLFSELAVEIYLETLKRSRKFKECVVSFSMGVEELQESTACGFEDHCETGMFGVKFHLLDHLCEDLDDFWKQKIPGCTHV